MYSGVSSFIWIYGEPCDCFQATESLLFRSLSLCVFFLDFPLFHGSSIVSPIEFSNENSNQPRVGWLIRCLKLAILWIAWQIVDSRLMIYWNWLWIGASLAEWNTNLSHMNNFFSSPLKMIVLFFIFNCCFFQWLLIVSTSLAFDSLVCAWPQQKPKCSPQFRFSTRFTLNLFIFIVCYFAFVFFANYSLFCSLSSNCSLACVILRNVLTVRL